MLRRNGQVILQAQYSDLLAGRDIAVQKGDEIVVRPNSRIFTVLGAVAKAGNVELTKPNLTLLEALGRSAACPTSGPTRPAFSSSGMGDVQNNPTARGRVFRLDLNQPVSIFVAQQFGIQPRDVVYVTNAPLYEYNKILTAIYRTFSMVGVVKGCRDADNDVLSWWKRLAYGALDTRSEWREQTKFRWGATGVAMLFVVAALVLWIAPSRQTSSAQDAIRPTGPLISRGYTDAPAGTAVLAGDPEGGGVLPELRVTEGQTVKRDEVIAVLSNYPKADVTVRTTEAELEKAKRQREAMVSGYRTAEIAMQEVVVKRQVRGAQAQEP